MATSLFEGLVDPRQKEYERQQAFMNTLASTTDPRAFNALVSGNLGRSLGQGLMNAAGVKNPEEERYNKIQEAIKQVKGMAGTESEKLNKLADILDQAGYASDAFRVRGQARSLVKEDLDVEASKARIEQAKAGIKTSEAQVKKIEEDIKGDRFKQIAKIMKVKDPLTQEDVYKQFYETYERQPDGSYKLFGVSETPNKNIEATPAEAPPVNPAAAAWQKRQESKKTGEAPTTPTPTAPAGVTLPANKQEWQRQLSQAFNSQDGKRYKYLIAYGKTKGW